MKRAVVWVMVLGLGLGGCQSKYNPVNWFGSGPKQGTPVAAYTQPVDPRGLVEQVVTLKVDPYPGGAIVRATGLPPTQGFWDASLVQLPDDGKGRIAFEFRIVPPLAPTPPGSQPSREVTVAVNLTDYKLQDISAIEVRGAKNAMTAHR